MNQQLVKSCTVDPERCEIVVVFEEATSTISNKIADIIGRSLAKCDLEYLGYHYMSSSARLVIRYSKSTAPEEIEEARLRLIERFNAER